MPRVSMKELLESGAHFGHLTRRWNPKMKTYIYGDRNGIHIIDLHQTLKGLETACEFLHKVALNGGCVLFVGTKKQAQEAVVQSAAACGMFSVAHRWQGGMLTNFQTIRESIAKLGRLEEDERTGRLDERPKKEAAQLRDQMAKLKRVLGGIEDMPGMPSALFVVDVSEEHIAVSEARKLHIPVVAVVDTNCDPEVADYVIPCNDDAIRAIKLVCQAAADAVIEALLEREKQIAEGQLRANAVDAVRRRRTELDPRLTGTAPVVIEVAPEPSAEADGDRLAAYDAYDEVGALPEDELAASFLADAEPALEPSDEAEVAAVAETEPAPIDPEPVLAAADEDPAPAE